MLSPFFRLNTEVQRKKATHSQESQSWNSRPKPSGHQVPAPHRLPALTCEAALQCIQLSPTVSYFRVAKSISNLVGDSGFPCSQGWRTPFAEWLFPALSIHPLPVLWRSYSVTPLWVLCWVGIHFSSEIIHTMDATLSDVSSCFVATSLLLFGFSHINVLIFQGQCELLNVQMAFLPSSCLLDYSTQGHAPRPLNIYLIETPTCSW